MTSKAKNVRSTLRGCLRLAGFTALTLPLMPVQAILKRASPRLARELPHWYHGRVCRVLGLSIDAEGELERERPVLVIANHSSWLDIPLLSAIGPVSFVAKKEIGGWPFVATLARLQRTVFVDRERRQTVASSANEIMMRLEAGDKIVLFAEGTSTDGNRVLPFKTSLFAAVKPTAASGAAGRDDIVVQTVTVAYVRRDGLPLGWAGRRALGYFGDVPVGSNAWSILTAGPLRARVVIDPPVALSSFADRKQLAQHAYAAVKAGHLGALRGEGLPGDAV